MRSNRIRRHRFRSNDRGFRRNSHNAHAPYDNRPMAGDQQRSGFLKGNQNPSKLLEKYTNLAKEALSTGDRVLSENYSQHADHFSRIVSDRNSERVARTEINNTNLNNGDDNFTKDQAKKNDVEKSVEKNTNPHSKDVTK